MSYSHLSFWYDAFMSHVDYTKWTTYFERTCNMYGVQANRVLDLGCGTGEWLLEMHERGLTAVGVDLSEQMLAVAQAKLQEAGYQPLLYQGDMSDLPPVGSFDVVTIFCDSLNYLQDEESVTRTLASCFNLLNKGGLLLFDVHSPIRMEAFPGEVHAQADEEVSYIWHSFVGEAPLSVVHELTFFVRQQDGRYERLEEAHFERTYTVETYKKMLKQAGFTDLNVTADFTNEPPTSKSERLFFSCRKV